MTTTPQTSDETIDVVAVSETTFEPVCVAPVLITEKEVTFNTAAAALAPPATTPRHWPGTTLIAAMAHIHVGLPAPRPIRPRREASYFVTARMSRLMDHL